VAGQGNREKVAVLGGGPAAITAAFELTATPELRDRFEVTVYQPGWRLGGKCATGRNLQRHGRIEEHGLHLWFGFYDNAFGLMRATYEELGRRHGHPLATFDDAFEPCDELVLFDHQGDGWQAFPFTWPRNEQLPGQAYPLPDVWEITERVCEWAVAQWEALWTTPSPRSRPSCLGMHFTAGWFLDLTRGLRAGTIIDAERRGEQLLYLARHLTRAYRIFGPRSFPRLPLPGVEKLELTAESAGLHLVAFLLTRFRDWMWEQIVRDRCEQDARLRLFFTMFDTFASATAGVAADGVLEHGWEIINDRDLCKWLEHHGAKQVTVGKTPERRSPLLRAIYDVAFAYPGGVIDNANAAAGTALNDLLRLAFTYRGSLFYKPKAGMAETVLTPLYQVLKKRGVKFNFFHAVLDLRLSSDGSIVDEIDVVPQVELKHEPYDPLITVKKIESWPNEPIWSQLRDGERHRRRGIDFELNLNPLDREPMTLERGKQFDTVVLGIPVGALRPLCSQIVERHEPFARMLDSATTVRTQAVQLWLTKSTKRLGWAYGEKSVTGSYEEPLDTWCDMSQLLSREIWSRGERPGAVAYFCGVLEHRQGEGHKAAMARVKRDARRFIERDLGGLLPRARGGGPGGNFDWTLLADGQTGSGPSRLAAQYWRANTSGSERYVLTPAKSMADRLGAGESGVNNLVLAGDWTRNGIDGGCVEAAVVSGMQAARALIGHDRAFTGESPTWLTDRKFGHRCAGKRAGNGTTVVNPAPPFVLYGSRVSAPPPVLCREGRFLGFLLKGNKARIERTCERVLNVAAGPAVEYRVLTPYALMLVGSFAKVSSGAPGFQDWGFVQETHLSLWLPLAAGKREGKGFIIDRHCLTVPYMFVDNPLSYLGGREDFGYPKAMACFSPTNGLGDKIQVQAFGGELGPGNQAGYTPLVELERMQPPRESETPQASAPAEQAASPVGRALRGPEEIAPYVDALSLQGELPILDLGITVADFVRAVLDKTAQQVFLKQFRDAESAGDACYRAIIESPVLVTEPSLQALGQEWQVTILGPRSHPIVEELGIESQPTSWTFELGMNLEIDVGKVVAP
jgi:uncharacterized protein with NAD-binding domain and iron-sulfur cluster